MYVILSTHLYSTPPRVCEQNRVYLEAPYYVLNKGTIYLLLIMIRTRHLPNRPGRSWITQLRKTPKKHQKNPRCSRTEGQGLQVAGTQDPGAGSRIFLSFLNFFWCVCFFGFFEKIKSIILFIFFEFFGFSKKVKKSKSFFDFFDVSKKPKKDQKHKKNPIGIRERRGSETSRIIRKIRRLPARRLLLWAKVEWG